MRSPIGWVESVPPQDAGTHRDDTHTNTRDSGLCSSQNSPFFLVEMLWRDDLLAAAAGKGWGYCCCCRVRLVVIAERVTTMMLVPAVQALALSLRFSGGGGGWGVWICQRPDELEPVSDKGTVLVVQCWFWGDGRREGTRGSTLLGTVLTVGC